MLQQKSVLTDTFMMHDPDLLFVPLWAGTLNSAVWLAGMKVNVVSLCKVRDKSTDSHMQVVRTERFKNSSYAGSGPEVHKETTLKGSSAVRWSHRNV